jgi:hypothetical protein
LEQTLLFLVLAIIDILKKSCSAVAVDGTGIYGTERPRKRNPLGPRDNVMETAPKPKLEVSEDTVQPWPYIPSTRSTSNSVRTPTYASRT